MKPSRIVPLVFILAALIVVECSLLSRCGQELTEKQTLAMQTPEPTGTPEPTAEPAPVSTATPSPTPAPTATPEPASEEIATTEMPSIAESGTLTSDTGTAMNLTAEWTAEPDGEGNVLLTIRGTVESYSLQVAGVSDGVTVTLGNCSADCDTFDIYINENIQTISDLFEATLTVPADVTGTLTVCWHYNGTYSGVSLPDITAEGDVTATTEGSNE